jgi:hypothetical protein
MKINEEDGGENGKRARKAGLYSRSGGEGCPCPIGPRLTASCNSQVVRLQLKYNILAVSVYVRARCMTVCGVCLCVVYVCVWCMTVCGVCLCVVYVCVWCMSVCGVCLCVVYVCV